MWREHENPYLAGNFAPVHEELSVPDLRIEGELPATLCGVYLRNGPNPAFEPLHYQYPFDGDGMIDAVALRKGKASYRNRFVDTAAPRSAKQSLRLIPRATTRRTAGSWPSSGTSRAMPAIWFSGAPTTSPPDPSAASPCHAAFPKACTATGWRRLSCPLAQHARVLRWWCVTPPGARRAVGAQSMVSNS
ncbi:MAG: carotenoid oxygenase family protein [Candidatus Accumulibacter sp.]|nr:carotenoid oxygenase family protein [Accumulibacter sp.]